MKENQAFEQLTIDDKLDGEYAYIPQHTHKPTNQLKFKRLSDSAIIPTKAHPTDSGFDLYASEDVIIEPGETVIVPTGIAIELPEGTEAQIRPRSGITAKTKLRVQLGTVDYGYSGEIGVIVDNISSSPDMNGIGSVMVLATVDGEYESGAGMTFPNDTYLIRKGEKIAQLVVQYLPQVTAVEVGELKVTERSGNGFGSTGV